MSAPLGEIGKNKKMGKKRKARANGEGTLERRAGGKYLARWMANGKRYSRTTDTRDRRKAEERLEEFLAPFRLENEQRTLETLTGRIEGVKAEIREWQEQRPALRLVDAFEAYRASTARPDAGARTLAGYESFFKAFRAWMSAHRPEAVEVRDVTAADAEAYASAFMEKHTAGTFNKHLIFLRCLWRTLIEGDEGKADEADRPETIRAKIPDNPWLRIRKRKHTPCSRRELTVEELGAIIAAAAGEMRLLIAIGIYSGLRLGDCALLEWGHVDLVRGLISVVPRKTARRTGKRVVIPLHKKLAEMLADVPTRKRRGYVLPETAATYRRDASAITARFCKLLEGCGIQTGHVDKKTERKVVDVGFHSLRHTFVSLSANAGAPMAAVQSIVGHGSPAMTRHYYHENEGVLRGVVAALPDVSSGRTVEADASAARLSALCAILDGMSRDDLKKARAEIERRLAGRGKASRRRSD